MIALKISLLLGAALVACVYFNDGIAQTFSNNESENAYYPISARQQLVVDLLRQEIKENPEFSEYAEAINEQLNQASEDDLAGPECYKYTPLLVEAVNSKDKFIDFFYIQGNFKYTFDTPQNILKTFTFYEWYENDELEMLVPYVDIKENNTEKNLRNMDAINYIVDNYCKPLNQILDQNSSRSIPQLLQILRQYFSK